MITFPVHDVQPVVEALPTITLRKRLENRHPDISDVYTSATMQKRHLEMLEATRRPIEACADVSILDIRNNALLSAVHEAYNSHRHLSLSPDSIWLTIVNGLSAHIRTNSERLRHQFVDFEGKKYLEIDRPGFVKGEANNDWLGCWPEFSDQLAEYIGKKRDLIVSDFSTTGVIEKAASEIALMDALSSYFDYGVQTLCGFPTITLEGTKEDWEDIYLRAGVLAEFDLGWWVDHLLPTLEYFIRAIDNDVDIPFWQSLIKIGGGSGGPYVNGGINAFFPYMGAPGKEFRNSMLEIGSGWSWEKNAGMGNGHNPGNYPNSMCAVPFKWHYYETTFEMEFLGGLVGVAQAKDGTLSAAAGWAVREEDIEA